MAQTYKATYKTFNGTDWDTYYFKTLASLVIPEANHKFVTDSEKTAISGIAGLSGAGFIKKTANGYAIDANTYLTASSTLDATKLSGKVPIACIPDSVLGQLEYKGVFNASAQSSVSGLEKGWYYICNTAGQYNPDGTTSSTGYNVGDWAVYNGSSWDKVDNTDAISSWCGLTGAITVAQARNALAGDIANNDAGFVSGHLVYNSLKYEPTVYNSIHIGRLNNGGSALYFGYDPSGGVDYNAYIDSNDDDTGYGQYLCLHAEDGVRISANEGTSGNHIVKFVTDEMSADIVVSFPSESGEILLDSTGFKKGLGNDLEIISDVKGNTYGTEIYANIVFKDEQEEDTLGQVYYTFDSNDTYALGHDLDNNNGRKGTEFYSEVGFFYIMCENGSQNTKAAALCTSELTKHRIFDFPDKSGMIALTKDLPKTYIQSTQPTGSDINPGDFWFDTSN